MDEQRKSTRFQLPATLAALAQLEGKVQLVLTDPPGTADRQVEQYSFTLALHELCANIVEHAYSDFQGEIDIQLALLPDPARLQAVVLDTGVPFDRSLATAPNLDEPQEGGYGLFLIEQLVDEVQYKRLPGGNEWRLTRRLD